MIYLTDDKTTYELETIQDVEEVVQRIYFEDDICMSELLASLEIGGLSIEATAELYISLRNYVGDGISVINEEGEFAL